MPLASLVRQLHAIPNYKAAQSPDKSATADKPADTESRADTFEKRRPSEADSRLEALEEEYQLSSQPFIINVQGGIDESSSKQICQKLMECERWYKKPDGSVDQEKVKAKPVRMLINSPGGSIQDLYQIIDHMDALKNLGVNMETYATFAASAGAIIFSCGSKGHRFIYPRGHLMIHQGWIGNMEPSKSYISEAQKDLGYARKLNDDMLQTLFENCYGKTSQAQLLKDSQFNHYLNARQAIDYGLADDIKLLSLPPLIKTKTSPKIDDRPSGEEESLPADMVVSHKEVVS